MLQLNLENLKKLVRDAKAKSPNRHIYPEIVKNGVAHLLTQMSTKEICKELGLSRNFVETINRLSGKSKDPVVKVSPIKSAPELHFLQMSNVKEREKNDGNKPFMKVTSPSGIIIEIWG